MKSIWTNSCILKRWENLNREIETEIAVIGGGITGILTAYLLQREGRRAVVLERYYGKNHIPAWAVLCRSYKEIWNREGQTVWICQRRGAKGV